MTARTCAADGCEKTLGKKNVTGFCQPCATRQRNKSPEHRAKVSATHSARYATDLDYRQRVIERNRQTAQRPEVRAALSQRMKGNDICYLANTDRPAGSESRRIAGIRVSRTKLADIPTDFHDHYKVLRRKGYSGAEAKAMIFEQAEVERRRIRAELGEAA